jgi:hypothetical protein
LIVKLVQRDLHTAVVDIKRGSKLGSGLDRELCTVVL